MPKKKSPKLPSFQFYPGDWLKDPAVRAVSLEARGLWIDMLCLMHESSRRGYLQHETGGPVSAEQLARMTGCSPAQVESLLSELDNVGVFSRAEKGLIFCRRMVRDERIRQVRAEVGRLGGNPILLKQGVNQRDNHPPNQKPTPSSSSSSSSSPSGKQRPPPKPPPEMPPIPRTLDQADFVGVWWEWVEYRRAEKKKPVTPTSAKQLLHKLEAMGADRAIAALQHSMANGWQGVFEPKVEPVIRHASVNGNGNGEIQPTASQLRTRAILAQRLIQ